MSYDYRGWRITVVITKSGEGWVASATVRAPGTHRSLSGREIVPPVAAATRERAFEELLARTHAWTDRYAFGELET